MQRYDEDDWGPAGLLGRLLARRLRPAVGWPLGLLALFCAICPAFAASDSSLRLPFWLLCWAGLLGCAAGMRVGRPQRSQWRLAATRRRGWVWGLWLVLGSGLGGAVLWASAANDALPPSALPLQDLGALATWAWATLRHPLAAEAPPLVRSWAFLARSLPRAWRELAAAPQAGAAGARLIVATSSTALTWAGALLLGWALAQQRSLLGWALPLLAALLLTTVLGGGGGLALLLGLAALLLLTVSADFRRRELIWSASAVAYPDELRLDVTIWGGLAIVAALLVAWLLPTSWDTLVARWLWADVEVPSGIAVLERQARGTPTPAAADVGLSRLPALPLGQSLEQGPPEQVALQIQLDAPLPPSPWPRYWRARVLNLYSGRSWTSDARVRPFAGFAAQVAGSPGAIIQQIADLRPQPDLLLGLPDMAAVSVPAQAEYLADGTLAALTAHAPARYTVLSWPQGGAATTEPGRPPPDMRGYLLLPAGLPPRVRELARTVAGDAPPAAQALALETYLRALPYTYAVEPLPADGEAVDQFLFEMRHGYCTYYASAMAVMARSLGIPSRIAVGYSTGSLDPTRKSYSVYERDAHAWPELYIDGRWLPFEPTPIRPLPQRGAEAGQASPLPTPVAPEPAQRDVAGWLWALAGVLALGLLALGAWRWHRVVRPSALAQVQLHLEAAGGRLGIAWPQGATLHEYAALLAARVPAAASDLGAAVDLLSGARYGGRALSEEQLRQLRRYGERIGIACQQHVSQTRGLR